ncbi:MAG: hypothetical protein Q9161_004866 [Pseudevernia consocians]
MNWTGGALSRSRNANAKVSLSVKQKNHFAKARVKLQSGKRPSPPEIQYFDFGEWKPECGAQDDRHSHSVKQRISSQTKLDQFENVQGVVKKLKSLRPRNGGNKRRRSIINDTEGHVLPSGIPIPPISPTIISTRPPSSSSRIQAEPTAKRNVELLRTSDSSTSDELDSLVTLDSVEAKRRKLLQESDWVGVERQIRMSHPVKMKFTDAKDRDLIGRRRPLRDSVVGNRWNVQDSRRMRIPLMVSESEKSRALHRGLANEYGNADGISIRIGSTATNKGPISDEILDCYQSPAPAQRSSHTVETFDYDNTTPLVKPQHRRSEVTTPLAFRKQSSEPFRSLFSPEEVDQSGIAELVEAATMADDGNLSLAEDEIQLPEDYHFPETEPAFRLVFEQTPQLRVQTSELNDSSSPIVRGFAFTEGHLPLGTIEQRPRPEDRSVLEEQISEHAPVGDAEPSTSPLSIATSQYMQDLENQGFGSGRRRIFETNMADEAATATAQSVMVRNKAEENRGITGDREPVPPNDVQDNEKTQPTGDEDEIWRNFINLDNLDDFQSIQEQPTSTHIPHSTVRASAHEEQVLHQDLPKPNVLKVPPPSRDDDELVWQNIIFIDSSPNDDEWVIEEPASPECPSDIQISTYNPARTQPSMIAEAATSPVKQNPHLMDEVMLDDSTPVLDAASRYAHTSASATGSPGTTGNVSSVPPSDSRDRSSNPATASPAAHGDSQSHNSSDPTFPNTRTPPTSNPSSLIAEASSSNPTQHPSPTGATHNPSSDELAGTPSRLRGRPATKEKIVFQKPSRYVGERANDAPKPVHLGRNVSKVKNKNKKKKKEEKKKKEKRSLAEAVERAKTKMGVGGWKQSIDRRDEGDGDEEETTEQDDIVDD